MTKRAKRKSSAESPSGQTTAESPLFSQGSGVRSDAQMVERALRQRFPIREEYAQALATKVAVRALQTDNDRNLAALSRVVVQMASLNQKDELAQLAGTTGVNITIVNEMRAAMAEVREDPDYVEHLYATARAYSGDDCGEPGIDGDDAEPGAMETLPAPRAGGPGASGSDLSSP